MVEELSKKLKYTSILKGMKCGTQLLPERQLQYLHANVPTVSTAPIAKGKGNIHYCLWMFNLSQICALQE
jgi:hypothetical protein